MTSFVRHSNESLFVWMAGVTLTLAGVAFTVLPEAQGTDLVAIGITTMGAGLMIPVADAAGQHIKRLAESRRGDEA